MREGLHLLGTGELNGLTMMMVQHATLDFLVPKMRYVAITLLYLLPITEFWI